nr:hypothetical protein GCM10010200_020210 [Actinomadura rugatobispora]
MPGRIRSTRRAVNARATSRRQRVWSGGSANGLPWLPNPIAVFIRAASGRAVSRLNRQSDSTALVSAYRVTSQARSPLGSRTRATGSRSRSSANSAGIVIGSVLAKGKSCATGQALGLAAIRRSSSWMGMRTHRRKERPRGGWQAMVGMFLSAGSCWLNLASWGLPVRPTSTSAYFRSDPEWTGAPRDQFPIVERGGSACSHTPERPPIRRPCRTGRAQFPEKACSRRNT